MSPIPVLEISEWHERECEGVALTLRDRALVDQLNGEGRVEIDELRTGVRVGARSWVGVIRLDEFEVRIVPKLAGENLGLVRMIEFASGLDALRRNVGERELALVLQGGLLDLLALLLAEACDRIIQGGLRYDYITEEEELPVLRGRLLVERQLRRRFGQLDRLECRYDEHSSDILDNRILAFGLNVCRRIVRHPLVQGRVNTAYAIMSEACSIREFDWRASRQYLTYDRLNEHYKEAHELAFEILEGLGVQNLFSAKDTRSFAFLLDMNLLFERFFYRFLDRTLTPLSYRVHYQPPNRSILWNATERSSYGTVRPDFVIERVSPPLGRLVADTKYKLYDEQRLDPSDIYQLFLYAYTYRQSEAGLPEALLIYPASTSDSSPLRLEVRREDHQRQARIQTFGFHIPDALEEIDEPGPVRRRLIQQVDQTLQNQELNRK